MKINTLIAFILFVGWIFSGKVTMGQNLTLKQCVEYANQNSNNIKSSEYDVSVAQTKVNEQIGTMLPQIDASGSYTNNLKLSTTLLPGEIMGKPGTKVPVTMGTKNNLSGGVTVSQKIFDPTFGVALKASKLSKEQAELISKQTLERTQYNVCTFYYQTLVIGKQINSLKITIASSKTLLEATELKFKNGMAKKVDVDKIRVSYNNSLSQLQQSELNYEQSLNNLKLYMGMPVENSLTLADTVINIEEQIVVATADSSAYNNRTDYQLQKLTLNAYQLDKQRNRAGYLPSLSLNYYNGYSAMRNEFDFFDKGGEWFPSSYIGVSLRVPIFDGLQKHARVSQSKLNIEKSKTNIRQTQQAIKVELTNSEIQYKNAIENIKNEKANLDLAESVYKDIQLQYQQGMSTSLDLVQSEASYNQSLNQYYNKLLNLYIARIALEQSKGNLTGYINNLK